MDYLITEVVCIYCEIALGSPRANCKHFGICHIARMDKSSWEAFQPTKIRRIKGILSSGNKKNLCLTIPYSGMMKTTNQHFFSSDLFPVESAYPMPTEIAASFGAALMVIRPGNYRILKNHRLNAYRMDLDVVTL